VRLYRGEHPDYTFGGAEAEEKINEIFGRRARYVDVPGLCKAATVAEIEAQGWSLNAGLYVGVSESGTAPASHSDAELELLSGRLNRLNAQARELEDAVTKSLTSILTK
jgi:type I restriction enzyme M protein